VHGVERGPADPASRSDDQQHSQLLQLARVGQSFSAGSYQQVLLKEDVVEPLQVSWSMLAQRQRWAAADG
jgi:two-component system sensor histidine kinase BasS